MKRVASNVDWLEKVTDEQYRRRMACPRRTA
jgi:hypothetical protein